MFSYDFMQNAFFVAICISLLCPCIGIFMVLRRSSMIGDTMSHASLAGITLGLLTNTNPILGAFIFTAICGALIEFLRKYFSHHLDLILTIILSLSIGTAITLISSGKLKANANVFFFGSILTVNAADMISIAVLTILSVLTLYFLYNSLLYIAYDEEAARVAGVKVDFINYIFAILMAAAVSNRRTWLLCRWIRRLSCGRCVRWLSCRGRGKRGRWSGCLPFRLHSLSTPVPPAGSC